LVPFRPRRHHLDRMREGITVEVSAADRARLEAIVADRNSPQKHVWRAEIILATAKELGASAIVRRTGKSKPCVRRWRERFAAEGGGRAAARQDPPAGHAAAARGGRRAGGRADDPPRAAG
jgi:Homeodomain-like domain